MSPASLHDVTRPIAIEDRIEPFLNYLRSLGYAERTLRKKRSVVSAFARWTTLTRASTATVNDNQIVTFVQRSPHRSSNRITFEHGILRLFARYVQSGETAAGTVSVENDSADAEPVLGAYETFLRNDRGLAENSLRVYVPLIRILLSSQTRAGEICVASLDALAIRDFMVNQTRDRSAEYTRLLSVALRSFLRFLFLSGLALQDLSSAVPTVRRYRQRTPPAFLSPIEIDRVLAAPDCSTPTGCRDRAILLLLARLGLRAGEIASLELDDIRWRTGEIVVRGKGRIIDHLPLLSDVGEALAAYLRDNRGTGSSRRIFLRMQAPHTALTGPAAIGHIVRHALRIGGIQRTGRGAAHLFRHGLGTRMIRAGASMAEISEVLRHRSPATTAIYTQVSFEALRGVALPWPITGDEL